MGNNKEYLLQAFTKEDFTDPRIIAFKQQHNDFSSKEYQEFLKTITIENEHSKRIISFLAHYQKGCLCPQICNAYEPLKVLFNPDDISAPIDWLSQPGSAFYFKRKKTHFKCDGVIENYRYAPAWERINRNTQKLIQPVLPEPELLGEIKIWFDKRDLLKYNKGIPFFEEILHEIDQIVKISRYSITTAE